MNIFKINTTAFEEENFFIMTTISESDLVKTIKPIIQLERDGQSNYDNDMLINALKVEFPNDTIEYFDEIPSIKI